MLSNNYNEHSVDDFIQLIIQKKINKKELILILRKKINNKEFLDSEIEKIDTAHKRINEPLELSLKLFYFMIPFGIINMFLNNEDQNFSRFKKHHYIKKIKDRYIYSLFGFITYIITFTCIGIFSR